MIDLVEILEAQRRLRPYLQQPPLIHSPFLSEHTGGDVWLKLENQQPTGSFKVRGALNKISQLAQGQKKRGLVTASAGNHGLGVAFAAQTVVGLKIDVFVPQNAPQAKVDKLQRFPVTIYQIGKTYEAAHQAAAEFAAQRGAVEIAAYDDLAVIAGQGTIGLELMTQLPACTTILLPIGGGGMIAGVATAVRQIKPSCRVVGVQPEASPAAKLSFQQGQAIDPYDHAPTIADGLAGGFGAVPFSVLRANPPEVVLVSEAAIRQAIFLLLEQHQLVIEPSGATAVAAMLSGEVDLAGETAVCVLSGGNLDTQLLRDILNEK